MYIVIMATALKKKPVTIYLQELKYLMFQQMAKDQNRKAAELVRDAMDEYIREDVLLLQGIDYTVLEKVAGECASRVYNALMHQHLEPGTKEAFNGYVVCLHQLYLMGAAMQLKRIGYHMTKMN